MEHLPEFIINHWMMSAAFIVVLLLVIMNEMKMQLASGQSLEPYQVVNLMNRNNAIIVDIRTPEQFKAGHILNAINIKTDDIKSLIKYKQKEVVIVCDSGAQAGSFSASLKKDGFDKVSILRGGVQAWQKAEMPIT